MTVGGREVTRIALGTWSIGGWMWGETTDEEAARGTIRAALDAGVDFFDTAPVYGFGYSERTLGRVLREEGRLGEVTVATKFGMVWDEPGGEVRKHTGRDSVLAEVEASLDRLGVDTIDLYLAHWPDPDTSVEETALAAAELLEQGVVRAIGACNHSADQLARWSAVAPLHAAQFRYNLFERDVEPDALAFCRDHGVPTMAYSPLARGMLTGAMRPGHEPTDSARRAEMFHGASFASHLAVVERLREHAEDAHHATVLVFALRWLLDRPGVSTALWGARRPEQLAGLEGVDAFRLTDADYAFVDRVIAEELGGLVRGGGVG